MKVYLGDGGGGTKFGGADIAFCALSGWVLLPEKNFHNGKCYVPPLEDISPGIKEMVSEFRETVAGKHVLMCYRENRVKDD